MFMRDTMLQPPWPRPLDWSPDPLARAGHPRHGPGEAVAQLDQVRAPPPHQGHAPLCQGDVAPVVASDTQPEYCCVIEGWRMVWFCTWSFWRDIEDIFPEARPGTRPRGPHTRSSPGRSAGYTLWAGCSTLGKVCRRGCSRVTLRMLLRLDFTLKLSPCNWGRRLVCCGGQSWSHMTLLPLSVSVLRLGQLEVTRPMLILPLLPP